MPTRRDHASRSSNAALSDLVDALAGLGRDRQQRHALQLRQAFLERRLDAVEQRRGVFGDVPLVDRDDQRAAFLDHLRRRS